MRVTMIVRCLAMMRGGGETRHLAWMRELTELGVEVDVIAGQLTERVANLTPFLSSHDVEDQRKVLFAFRKRFVADAEQREIVVETDLTGGAQSASDGQLPRLCNLKLPERNRFDLWLFSTG